MVSPVAYDVALLDAGLFETVRQMPGGELVNDHIPNGGFVGVDRGRTPNPDVWRPTLPAGSGTSD